MNRRKLSNEQKLLGILVAALVISSTIISAAFLVGMPTSTTEQPNSKLTVMSPSFRITLLTPQTNLLRQQWAQIVSDNLRDLGIQAERVLADWSTIYQRALTPDPSMVGKTYDEGGFDTLFVGYNVGADPNPYGMFHSSQFAPYGQNYYLWNNSLADELALNATRAMDFNERMDYLKQWQAVAYDELPSIALHYNKEVVAFDKHVNGTPFTLYYYPAWCPAEQWRYLYTNYSTSMTIAQLAQCPTESLSPAHSTSYYDLTGSSSIYGESGLSGLLMRDAGMNIVPYLACNYTISPNGREWIFWVRSGMTFHDGGPVDGRDIVATIRAYLSPAWGSANYWYVRSILGSDAEGYGNYSVYFNGEQGTAGAGLPLNYYIVHFRLPRPWVYFGSDIAGLPCYPATVLMAGTNYTWNGNAFLSPNPTTLANWKTTSFSTGENVPYWYMKKDGTFATYIGPLGCGPYKFDHVDHIMQTVTLTKYTDYWNRAALEATGAYKINTFVVQRIESVTAAINALHDGRVQVLDCQYQLQRYIDMLDPAWSSWVAYVGFGVQEMGFNMQSPIWGTGLGTPLGQMDPSRAAEAAKHVRRAIEYCIPKDYIIKNILNGFGVYGLTTPVTPTVCGGAAFNWALYASIRNETQANAKMLAMQELRAAGYDFLPSGDLSVHVIDSQGASIGNASVVSTWQPTGQTPLSGSTDLLGNVVFSNVVAGNYTLRVSKYGYPDKYVSAYVMTNQTTSITVTLQFPTMLTLIADKPEYEVNESITVTAQLTHTGQPVSMAITSIEVRDPANNLVYIATGQTDQSGTCSFKFTAGLNWQVGTYTVFGVSYLNDVGSITAQATFRVIKLMSDVRMLALWAYNPSWTSLQNYTLGPLGHYWALGGLGNLGNGSAFMSRMTFRYPANLPANSIQALLATPPSNMTYISYTQISNTIYIYNTTMPAYSFLLVIVDTNITRSASYTSVTAANWRDTHSLVTGSGTKSLTLQAVWDTKNPVVIDSFRNTGTNTTYINVRSTLRNVGITNATFVCIVQVTDSRGLPLSSVMQRVTLTPGQSLVVNIRVNIPVSAPRGTYTINFSLFTDLPSNGGHAINYEQTTANIH